MTLAELRNTWSQRRDEWRRLGVRVDGVRIAEEILSELESLDASGEQLLTLVEAAAESGYAADTLGRLVREGRVPNAGRPNAPKIRRRDIPKKPGAFPNVASSDIVSADRRRIAASVLRLSEGAKDG